MTNLSRRKLLGFSLALIAAPAIVRASSLMPVRRDMRAYMDIQAVRSRMFFLMAPTSITDFADTYRGIPIEVAA